jgi:broad specificity phosphatase PhoE
MNCTRFWLIRHALVTEAARAMIYGCMDVDICDDTLRRQNQAYRSLAQRLPHDAAWVTSPLRRTQQTAQAIQHAGYPPRAASVEPGLIEQNLGEWQGLAHAELPARLVNPGHPFWPLAASETPPGGESMEQVLDRVGRTLEKLAHAHGEADIVCISHGGAIRAAIAHALGVGAHTALQFSVQNLGLTILERFSSGWRVVTVNEEAGAAA